MTPCPPWIIWGVTLYLVTLILFAAFWPLIQGA